MDPVPDSHSEAEFGSESRGRTEFGSGSATLHICTSFCLKFSNGVIFWTYLCQGKNGTEMGAPCLHRCAITMTNLRAGPMTSTSSSLITKKPPAVVSTRAWARLHDIEPLSFPPSPPVLTMALVWCRLSCINFCWTADRSVRVARIQCCECWGRRISAVESPWVLFCLSSLCLLKYHPYSVSLIFSHF